MKFNLDLFEHVKQKRENMNLIFNAFIKGQDLFNFNISEKQSKNMKDFIKNTNEFELINDRYKLNKKNLNKKNLNKKTLNKEMLKKKTLKLDLMDNVLGSKLRKNSKILKEKESKNLKEKEFKDLKEKNSNNLKEKESTKKENNEVY